MPGLPVLPVRGLRRYRIPPSSGELAGGDAFYISPTGNDTTGDGSLLNPWRTLTKLYASLMPGEIGYVRGGLYIGSDIGPVQIDSDGMAGAPITVQAYPGESPVFDGTNNPSPGNPVIWFRQTAAYHVLDGLTLQNWLLSSTGDIVFGGITGSNVHHIIVKRCTIHHMAGQTALEHAFYISSGSNSITIGGYKGDGNILLGAYPAETTGAGVEIGHTPGPTNVRVAWNAIDGFNQGIELFDSAITGSFLHNTLVHCYNKLRFTNHSTILARDNAGDATQNTDILDPSDFASTTADHNYWNQTITGNPAYGLIASDTAVGGALGGEDAGWVTEFVVPPPSISLVGQAVGQSATTTFTVTMPTVPAAGNILIAFGTDPSVAATWPLPANGQGGATWALIDSRGNAWGLFYDRGFPITGAGTTAIVFTCDNTGNHGANVSEWKGVGAADQESQGGSSGTTVTSPSVTLPTGKDMIVFAAFDTSGGASISAAGGGFTNLTAVTSGVRQSQTAYKIVIGGGGTHTCTWTLGASQAYDAMIASYFALSGARPFLRGVGQQAVQRAATW